MSTLPQPPACLVLSPPLEMDIIVAEVSREKLETKTLWTGYLGLVFFSALV